MHWLGWVTAATVAATVGVAHAAPKLSKPADDPARTTIAFVALREPKLPAAAEVESRYRAKWPEVAKLTGLKREKDVLTWDAGGAVCAIALMPAPVPGLGGPDAPRKSMMGRPSSDALAKHRAHLIVTASGQIPAKARDLIATALTGAAVDKNAVAVYWGPTGVVHGAEAFVGLTHDANLERLPLYVWLDLRASAESDGTSSGFTRGMERYGFMEFEARRAPLKPVQLVERFFNFAHYVLDNGPVLKDGDTIGMTATDKVLVEHRPSSFGLDRAVYRLTFPSAQPGRAP